MKRLVLFALLLASTPATAQTVYTTCDHSNRSFTCSTSVIEPRDNSAKIIRVEPRERTVKDAIEDAAWVKFCEPSKIVDKYGMTRYRYAHDGCDLGRTQ